MRSPGIAIAIAVGAVAVAAPIIISLQLSYKEALADEKSLTLGYANESLRRSEEASQQILVALQTLTVSGLAHCSSDEINLMRKIELASNYVQAIGRVDGNTLTCSSMGSTPPIPLGPPTVSTSLGGVQRLNLRLPIAGDHPLDVFAMDGFAFFIEPRLTVDMPTQGPNVSITLFVPSSANHSIIISQSSAPKTEWLRSIPAGSSIVFRDSGYIVAVTRAAQIDVAVTAAAPETYIDAHVNHFALIFVPIGLLCAALLAWAVTRITRNSLSLPSELRRAARRKEFFVEYQPVVELESGRWIGAEALVRWRRRARSFRPDIFIPIAEESGIVPIITACVAEIVAVDLPPLLKFDPTFFISINLAAADLRSHKTIGLMKELLRMSHASAASIKVEATESGFLQGEEAREVLDGIHELGIEVAIDDFGTGYSSLSRLQTLGVDSLKIDKSFVETIGTDGATSHVVAHIIDMAHSLKLTMVAEGVETAAQAEFLALRGVRYAQGRLFGMPVNFAEFSAALAARESAIHKIHV